MNNYTQFRETQRAFKTVDGTIKYIDQGEGSVILLLHGVPTSGWLYRKMILILIEKGFRVIVPDMLGFGASDAPKDTNLYSIEKQASRIIQLMDFLQISHWSHLFHDVSGLWTWEIFRIQPNRISNLIVLNTLIYEDGFKPPIRFGENLFTKVVMDLYTFKFINRFLINALFNKGLNTNNLSKSDLEGYTKPLLEGKNKGMYHFFSKTCHALPNYHSVLPTINIPTMIVWGENDEFLLWEPQKDQVIKDLKINSKNIHILKFNHFLQEEGYTEICQLIDQFLISE